MKKLQIPANLDLKSLFSSTEEIEVHKRHKVRGKVKYSKMLYKTKSLIKYLDHFHYIIGLIVSRHIKRKQKLAFFVNLTKEHLEEVMGKPASTLCLSVLETLKVIDINPKYLAGRYAKSYRLMPMYRVNEFKTVVLGMKFQQKRKRAFIRRQTTKATNRHLPEYLFQIKQLVALNFNDVKAIAYLERNQFSSQYANMLKVQIEDGWVGRSDVRVDSSGRLTSWVTSLKKELRPFIYDKSGRPLIYIDAVSSQTLHFAKHIKRSLDMTHSNNHPLPPDVATLLNDISRLENILFTAGIYDWISQTHFEHFNEVLPRETAKRVWVECFLNSSKEFPKLRPWVQSLFPEINKFINGSRESLWKDLHKSEADLIHGKVIRRIGNEVNDCTLFSIHDGLLVDEGHFDEIYNIFNEEIRSYFDFIPNECAVERLLKVKRLELPVLEIEEPCPQIESVSANNFPLEGLHRLFNYFSNAA